MATLMSSEDRQDEAVGEEEAGRVDVLLIAGADFVALENSFLLQLARVLAKSGGYRCTVRGTVAEAVHISRPEPRLGIVRAVPWHDLRANSMWSRLGLACAVAACSTPLGYRLLGGVGLPVTRGMPFRKVVTERVRSLRCRRARRSALHDYDLYHWHFAKPENLFAIDYIPPGSPLILSFWGSDLYRTAGVPEYSRQLHACERASVITMASPEMREAFLAKFGRHLQDKVRLVTFGTDKLGSCDLGANGRTEFLERHGIPTDRIVICVGHNGQRANQHLAVLEQLGALPTRLLKKTAIVVPMTYGATPDYLAEVQRALESLPTMGHVLSERLDDEAVGQLRNATDVCVHIPVSDQFSASMAESLYSGAVLITGMWLPYRLLRAAGIHYHEVAHVSEIARELSGVLEHYQEEKTRSHGNREKVRDLVSWDHAISGWLEVYRELMVAPARGSQCKQ